MSKKKGGESYFRRQSEIIKRRKGLEKKIKAGGKITFETKVSNYVGGKGGGRASKNVSCV